MFLPMNRSTGFQKIRLACECAALYLGIPALYAAGWLPVPVIPFLILLAAGGWLVLERYYKISVAGRLRAEVPATDWHRIFITYVIALPLLAGLLWLIKPEAMFSLLRHHPGFWLLIMFAYPVLSVLPQEVMYRALFFARYRPLFGEGIGMVIASAVMFSFCHVIFHNWISLPLTFIGGWLFARSYQRTSSLLLPCVEHALYGCAIFTLGYGEFFYKGTLHVFQH